MEGGPRATALLLLALCARPSPRRASVDCRGPCCRALPPSQPRRRRPRYVNRAQPLANVARHPSEFPARFRRDAFGRKSQPAIQHVKQAIAETRPMA